MHGHSRINKKADHHQPEECLMWVRTSLRFVGRVSVSVIVALALSAFSLVPSQVGAQQGKDKDEPPKGKEAKGTQPVKLGLAINDPKAFQGYTLLAPSTKTYLIDM